MYTLVLKESRPLPDGSDYHNIVATVESSFAPDIVEFRGKLYSRFAVMGGKAFYHLASILKITLLERILTWVLSRVAHT